MTMIREHRMIPYLMDEGSALMLATSLLSVLPPVSRDDLYSLVLPTAWNNYGADLPVKRNLGHSRRRLGIRKRAMR